MADYNQNYFQFKKRLQLLKLLTLSAKGLKKKEKEDRLRKIDELLKILDERYDEGRHLEPVISQIELLEHTK